MFHGRKKITQRRANDRNKRAATAAAAPTGKEGGKGALMVIRANWRLRREAKKCCKIRNTKMVENLWPMFLCVNYVIF